MTVTLYIGDVHERLAHIPDHSVDFVACSPPFLALRSYLPDWHPQKHLEIGSEATPADWLDTLLALTAEFRRILTPWGSIAIELGDTYAGSGGAGGDYDPDGWRAGQERFAGSGLAGRDGRRCRPADVAAGIAAPTKRPFTPEGRDNINGWPLAQSLCGIPDAYALSLEYGWNVLRRNAPDSPAGKWRVRNKKAWIRSNPPVGALGRKERPATSYITVACLRTDRYFDLDAVRQPYSLDMQALIHKRKRTRQPSDQSAGIGSDWTNRDGFEGQDRGGAPPLDWWHPIDATIDHELAQRAGARPGGNTRPGDAVTPGKVPGTGSDAIDGAYRRTEGALSVGARGWHIRRALQAAGYLPPDHDTYDISPRGYTGAHYAVWSPELARRLIDEMCPRRVCTVCGRPSERISSVDYEATTERRNGSKANSAVAEGVSQGHHAHVATNPIAHRQTVGWSDCGHNTWRPGTVLDPFTGSGTTLAVANDMGRDAVGIDIDQATYGMTVERLGPLIAQLELTVHWPEPNWNIPALPLGGGDYQPWAHMTGDQRRPELDPTFHRNDTPDHVKHNDGRRPRGTPRPVVEVPGQAGLFEQEPA